MRYLPLSLAALALAACGGSVDPDARAPVPHPEGSDGSVTSIQLSSFENPVTTTEMSGDAIEGEWTTSGRTATFSDIDENPVASVSCTAGSDEQPNTVTFRYFVPEDTEFGEDTAISIYTSAGSKSYLATAAPVEVTTPVSDYFATMLAASQGDIRIVFDEMPTIIPTGDAARTVVKNCRPQISYTRPEAEGEDDEE